MKIMLLKYLAKSDNIHHQYLALSSLHCLALIQENRDVLVTKNGIVETLAGPCHTAEPVIQREVASCFSSLSLSSNHRLRIARLTMSELIFLTWCAWKFGRGRQDKHFMKYELVLDAIVSCLEHEGIEIRRVVACAVTNMLTLCQIHPHIIQRDLLFVSVPKALKL